MSAFNNTQEASQDDSDNTLRDSRSSIPKVLKDQRRGSRRTNQDRAGTEPKSNTSPEVEDGRPKSPKKSKFSLRFLAFLNCCNSSNVGTDDASISPKKTKAQAPPDRQSTPEKAGVIPGNTSMEEHRSTTSIDGEKLTTTTTAAQPESHFENVQNSEKEPSHVDVTSNEPSSGNENSLSAENRHSDNSPTSSKTETVVVAGPLSGPNSPHHHHHHPGEAPTGGNNGGVVGPDEDEALSKPLPPEAEDDEDDDDDMNSLPQDEDPDADLSPGVRPLLPPTLPQDDQQQWLLPPPLPHLQNRKCLILDLDETLVHSSFKVLRNPFMRVCLF